MSRSNLVLISLAIIILLCPLSRLGTTTEREQISSKWTQTPPIVDGKFEEGEWSNPQIIMRPPKYPLAADAYFSNNASHLYVLLDVTGDETDEEVYRLPCYYADESLLVFNFKAPVRVHLVGMTGHHPRASEGFDGTIGFGPSPSNPHDHRLFEFSIPLTLIRAALGQSIDISSPAGGQTTAGPQKGQVICQPSIAYDAETRKDNVWPLGLQFSKVETWGILVIAEPQLSQTTTATTQTTSQPVSSTTQSATAMVETNTRTETTQPATVEQPPFTPWAVAIVVILVAIGAFALYSRSHRGRAKKNTPS